MNGSAGDANREMVLSVSQRLLCTVDAPPSGAPAAFALYFWTGVPGPESATRHPLGLGDMVFPTPLSGGLPSPRRIANNAGLFASLGVPDVPSSPAPSTLVDRVMTRPLTVTMQGIVVDAASQARRGASVTNAVIVRVP